MKPRLLCIISFLFLISQPGVFSQAPSDTTVYLITCGPGTETYSIYGHSALRVVIPEKKSDTVYNWGVFDFAAPNFAWKFAKGRLDYYLGTRALQSFLQDYFYEQRFVHSQRINLDAHETRELINMINENLKPENVKYRYDFFYDDCSTRIRDLLEKAVGDKLQYPPSETGDIPTFRDMVGKYQNPFPWYKFGVDLIMGSSSDKKAGYRDRMFLPLDMQSGLSQAVIKRDGKMIPLLTDPDVILDFNTPVVKQNILLSPIFVFGFLLIIIILHTTITKRRKLINLIDILVFSVFSVLAILMIFFNFFTDHQQMKLNLNILWLNPFLIVCLISLILKKTGLLWFRIVFFISVAFLVLQMFLPQEFNTGFYPLVLVILVRSSVRTGFGWNPFVFK